MTSNLFQPIKVGKMTLPNRVIMAPMTRGRSGADGVPTATVAEYYGQRASAGLIITEATAINARGDGWPGAPGIYNDKQQAGWSLVADAVHKNNGRIFMQIWHMGRSVLSENIDGMAPLAPSAVAAEGQIPNSQGVPTDFDVPKEMTSEEISQTVSDFVDAAQRAVDAGIDGVEIHAANNFLIDAFLRDGTNKRTDAYGGSIENRTRFLLEVVDAVAEKIGSDRVGVRFSPTNGVFGIADSNPGALFSYAASQLSSRNLAYLHLLEPLGEGEHPMKTDVPSVSHLIREAYKGVLIQNGGQTPESASALIESGQAEAVAFGVPFIANPDLVSRYQSGAELAAPNPDTFYTPGPEGYTDYAPL
ncbi:alkene reductase [Cognatishimia maritima]|uniref:N-ethylmaleimide reductase n=1 Tax=Cognatishimia maritima TaxID=870908 RepID=A0A1M5VZ95_9RHOB|nr:alkene reductase [Cognatishimia maritima]SHH80324.1 N-ethylmaleimide reductase [Cognatishimia maritima]